LIANGWLNRQQKAEYKKIDKLAIYARLHTECKCRKLKMGQVQSCPCLLKTINQVLLEKCSSEIPGTWNWDVGAEISSKKVGLHTIYRISGYQSGSCRQLLGRLPASTVGSKTTRKEETHGWGN